MTVTLAAIGCSSVSGAAGWTHRDPIATTRFNGGLGGAAAELEAGGSWRMGRGELGLFATLDHIGYANMYGTSMRYRRHVLGSGAVMMARASASNAE